MFDEFIYFKLSFFIPRCSDGRTTTKAEAFVSGRAEVLIVFAYDLLYVAQGVKSLEPIFIIYNK